MTSIGVQSGLQSSTGDCGAPMDSAIEFFDGRAAIFEFDAEAHPPRSRTAGRRADMPILQSALHPIPNHPSLEATFRLNAATSPQASVVRFIAEKGGGAATA